MADAAAALHAEILTSSEYLRKGIKREREFSRGGWTFRTVKAPILNTPDKFAWKRELQLYQAQGLPEATFGHSSVEVRHDASGVVLSFCALEALRAWCSLGEPPPKVPRSRHLAGSDVIWDWTFTSPYAGSVALAPLSLATPAEPDGGSIFPRAALDLACGVAQLRNPLCKCRGTPRPVLDSAGSGATATGSSSSSRPSRPPLAAPLPEWTRVECDGVDWKAMFASEPIPRFIDSVTLFEDDMHDFGISHLFVRLYIAETFWIAILRCFLRVDGIKCRLIESRYTCRFGSGEQDLLRRRRSWREASWDAVMASMGPGFPIEQINDSTSQCLPEKRAPVTEQLVLCGLAAALSAREQSPVPDVPRSAKWARPAQLRGASCVQGGHAAIAEGSRVELFDTKSGEVRWSIDLGEGKEVLALALSPSGGELAVGDDAGCARVLSAAAGAELCRFDVAVAGPAGTGRWVERLVWSNDGRQLAFAAGRVVLVTAPDGASIRHRHEVANSAAALAFVDNERLAVATYGSVDVLDLGARPGEQGAPLRDAGQPSRAAVSQVLQRGAARVQCLAVSPDGRMLAAGCLDKTARIWRLDSAVPAVDWIGFNGPVTDVGWSAQGNMLAACGGNAVFVRRDVGPSDESGTVCRGFGAPGRDGGLGSCPRLTSLAWCPSSEREGLLAAASVAGGALLFDVAVADGAFPRRCAPLAEVTPPGASPSARLCLLSFVREESALLVGTGDHLAAFSLADARR